MTRTRRTPAGDALTDLMLDLFRLNSLLLTSGDRLVAGLGLTSARWQILGAIVTVRNQSRGSPATWVPTARTCSGSSTTSTGKGSSRSGPTRITGELSLSS